MQFSGTVRFRVHMFFTYIILFFTCNSFSWGKRVTLIFHINPPFSSNGIPHNCVTHEWTSYCVNFTWNLHDLIFHISSLESLSIYFSHEGYSSHDVTCVYTNLNLWFYDIIVKCTLDMNIFKQVSDVCELSAHNILKQVLFESFS